MKKINIFDDNIINKYVTVTKYGILIFVIIWSGFIVLDILAQTYLLFFTVGLFLELLIIFAWFKSRQAFCKYFILDNNIVNVYSWNDKLENIIDLKDFLNQEVIIKIKGSYHTDRLLCLILYKNVEIYKEMEYLSYAKDNELLVIQNPLAIKAVKEQIEKLSVSL